MMSDAAQAFVKGIDFYFAETGGDYYIYTVP
jgi:hypothetical protein